MNRFPDHSRVLFVGDSITNSGLWVAHVFDHYLRNFPEADIRMYNAGISGGSVTSALEYYDRGNGENYRPTHAVIMLGINDVNRDLYAIGADEQEAADPQTQKRWQCICEYERMLRRLCAMLQARGVKITLLAPTGYDENQSPRTLDKIGCDAAMEYLGEINRRLAEEIGADFVNMHALMRHLSTAETLIRPDRVHPVEKGHVCMARIFLAAQGLVGEPTPLTLDELPQPDELLPRNRARYDAERNTRTLWNVEWLLLRNRPRDEQARRAFLKAFVPPAPFWEDMVKKYFELDGDLARCQAREEALLEACLNH